MIKMRIGVLFLFILMSRNVSGQNVQGKISAEGSNIPGTMKAENKESIVNVDLFTGIGTATIPIYEKEIDGLDVGVYINNNLKGIQVNQVASPVGLGWDLSTGGSITRDVMGLEDEKTIGNINAYEKGAWNFQFDGPPPLQNDLDCFTANFGGRTVKFFIYRQTIIYKGNCPEPFNPLTCPDLENRYHNHIYTEPRSELKIDFSIKTTSTIAPDFFQENLVTGFNANLENNLILSFKIRDEKGNLFLFERGDYERKPYDLPALSLSGIYYPTTKWNLTKITTYTGEVITYEYTSSDVEYVTSMDEQLLETDSSFYVPIIGTVYHSSVELIKKDPVVWNGKQSYISKITYPDGTKIYFDTQNGSADRCDMVGAHLLKQIRINSKYNDDVSNEIKYRFNYSYFNAPTQNFSNTEIAHGTPCNDIQSTLMSGSLDKLLRLKLNSIDKIGTNNIDIERYYSFGYDSQSLPSRLSPQTDHYGYANNGQTILADYPHIPVWPATYQPYHKFYYHYFDGTSWQYTFKEHGTIKSNNFTHTKACNLNKITNSNGGSIDINYTIPSVSMSPDAYNSPIDPELDKPEAGGSCPDGLIVSKLTFNDGYNVDNTLTTEYSYEEGQQFYKGGYYWYPKTLINHQPLGSNPDVANVVSRYYCNYFVSTQNLFHNSNHGYSKVSVTKKGYNGQQISKGEYRFSNLFYDNGTSNVSCLTYYTDIVKHTIPPLKFEKFRMGLLLESKQYDAASNPISQVNNEYTVAPVGGSYYGINSTPQPFYCHREFYYNSDQDGPMTSYIDNNNYTLLLTGQSNLTRTVEKQISNGQEMISLTDYHYDGNDNLTHTYWTDSKWQQYVKHTKYNYDYDGSGFDWSTWPNNIWDKQFALTDAVWKKNGPTDSSLVSFGLIRPDDINAIGDFKYTYSAEINQPISASQFAAQTMINVNDAFLTANSSPNLKKAKTYTKIATDFHKALEIKYGEEQDYSSFIYDTFLKEKIAEVSNARYDDIAFTSFDAGSTNYSAKGSTPPDYNKGNFDFEKSSIVLTNTIKPITGKYYYLLKQNTSTNYDVVSLNNLVSGKKYLFTFWARLASFQVLNGTQPVSVTAIINKGGWTLFSANITGAGSPITLTSTYGDVPIDEVRLYPEEATMDTYSYEPLFGVSSSCDESNNILYYEYDVFGRPSVVRDIDGNIIVLTKTSRQAANN